MLYPECGRFIIIKTVSPVDRGPDQCVGRRSDSGSCEMGEGGWGKGEMGTERSSWFIFRMCLFSRMLSDSLDSDGS